MHALIQQLKEKKQKEGGFTLIELLVVIAILGILAGVVVFAVQGLGDKGQANACKIDTRTIRTAEEAYFTQFSVYTDEDTLANVGGAGPTQFLSEVSSLHDITPLPAGGPPFTSYTITVANAKCGTVGAAVGGSNF